MVKYPVSKKTTVSRKPKSRVSKTRKTYSKARTITTGKGALGLLTSPSPFPLVWKGAKQHYAQHFALTGGASGLMGSAAVFTLNDQFDPLFSIGGHQPYGRDTMITMYDRYKVTGVTVEVTFTAPSINSVNCAIMFTNPASADILAGKSSDYVREIPNAMIGVLADSGSQKFKFKKYFPMYKLAGITKLQFDADIGIFDALSGNSPATAGLCKMLVAIGNNNSGSGCTAITDTVITMHTDWYQRKILAQS